MDAVNSAIINNDSSQQHLPDGSPPQSEAEVDVEPEDVRNISMTSSASSRVNNLASRSQRRSHVETDYNIRPMEFRGFSPGTQRRHSRQYGRTSQPPGFDASIPEITIGPEHLHTILTVSGSGIRNGTYRHDNDEDCNENDDTSSTSDSTVVKDPTTFDDDSRLIGDSANFFGGIELHRSYNDNSLIGGRTSFLGAVFIVCNAALGIGVVNIPHALLTIGGLYSALFTQCVVVCIVMSTLFLLGYCAERCQVSSFECVVGTLWGPKLKFLVELIIVLNGFLSCIMFLIIAGDQLPHVLLLLDPSKSPTYFRELSVVLSSLLILPLCIPKDIAYLSYPGLVSVVAVIYLPVAIIIRYFKPDAPKREDRFDDISFSWMGLLHSFPTLVLAYQCHLSCVPCYASLRNRSMTRWATIITIALLIVSGIYASVGFFGFMTFGNMTKSDVLLNYESKDDIMIFARLTLFCSVIFSYPSMHYVSRSAYQSMFKCRGNPDSPFNAFFTPAWLLGSLSASLFIPEIGFVINRFGPVAAFFILGFPGLCLIQLSRQHSRMWIFSAAVGIIYCILCVMVLACSFLSFYPK